MAGMPPDTDKLASWYMQFQAALERVRAGADIMPRGQLESVISAELGPEWRSKLKEFDDEPLAAASIGQVRRGTTGSLAPQLDRGTVLSKQAAASISWRRVHPTGRASTTGCCALQSLQNSVIIPCCCLVNTAEHNVGSSATASWCVVLEGCCCSCSI